MYGILDAKISAERSGERAATLIKGGATMDRNRTFTLIALLGAVALLPTTGWAAVWSSDESQPAPSASPASPAASSPSNPSATQYNEYNEEDSSYDAASSAEPPAAAPASQGAAIEQAASAMMGPEEEYDFGDFTSQALTVKAWESLILEDYAAVDVYTRKCIEMYEAKAQEQQAQLRDFAPADSAFQYWALNDVATCYFIQGRGLALRKQFDEARQKFEYVIKNYPYAQAWDSRGWFWKVAKGAKDNLTTLGTPYDFGDYTSQTLATKAWQALADKDYKGVELYAKKCLELYEAEAMKQQGSMTDFAPKEKAFEPWALNDVATCYFILGESYAAQKKYREARASYQKVVDNFGYAQCWDPKGWFWKTAVAAKGRFRKLAAQEKRGW